MNILIKLLFVYVENNEVICFFWPTRLAVDTSVCERRKSARFGRSVQGSRGDHYRDLGRSLRDLREIISKSVPNSSVTT